jgi:hypothetical protein
MHEEIRQSRDIKDGGGKKTQNKKRINEIKVTKHLGRTNSANFPAYALSLK